MTEPTRNPLTYRAFALEVDALAGAVVKLEDPASRFHLLRPFAMLLRASSWSDEEREGIRSLYRDRARRQRGLLRIHRLTAGRLATRRCEVCGWRIAPTGPTYCKPCRRRLSELEGADPAQLRMALDLT